MKKYLLLLTFFGFAFSSYACSCLPSKTFCETISSNDNSIREHVTVFHGRIISKNQDEMIVEVIRMLHGDPALSSIKIINGFGADCRLGNHSFNINEQFIFGTDSYNDVNSLTACGVPILAVSGNTVTGKVAPGINSTTINQLLNVAGCPDFKLDIDFEVFPNPSLSNAFFRLELKNEADVEITMFNAAGQRVYQKKWIATSNLMESLPSDDYPAGIYVVQLKAFETKFYRKLIISE